MATDPRPFVPPEGLLAPCSALLGAKGTGKTALARLWAEADPSIWLCSVAEMIGVVTLRSTFGHSDTHDLERQYHLGRLQTSFRKLREFGYARLLIDDAHLMDGRQLDLICFALDEVNVNSEEQPMAITLVAEVSDGPSVVPQSIFTRPAWDRFKDNVVFWDQQESARGRAK